MALSKRRKTDLSTPVALAPHMAERFYRDMNERADFIKKRDEYSQMHGQHYTVEKSSRQIILLGQAEKPIPCTYDLTDWSATGMNSHPKVKESAKKAIDEYGTSSTCSASTYGNQKVHVQLKEKTSSILGKEETTLFQSGYGANLGVIHRLVGPNSLIISDQKNHASIIDGIRLSKAKKIIFKHDPQKGPDLDDLEQKLSCIKKKNEEYDNIFVIVESIYSTSGNMIDLQRLCDQKKEYGFYIILDETYSFGFWGKKGLAATLGLSEYIDVITASLSKAMGGIGGVASSSSKIASYLKHSNQQIFSINLPPSVAAGCLKALEIMSSCEGDVIRGEIVKFADMLHSAFKATQAEVSSGGPLFTIRIKSTDAVAKTREMQKELLQQHGILFQFFEYPAVPKNQTVIRIQLQAMFTAKDMKFIVEKLIAEYKLRFEK